MGECWHAAASDDACYEIFIRADLAEPLDVLAVLVKELIHTALPPGVGHGKQFRDAAVRIGLQGPMRSAQPGVLLKARLVDIAAALGPLPHAGLHIDQTPLTAVAAALDRPKKQHVRMLKALCTVDDCGFLVRVAARPVRDIGPPHCPKHGAMTVELSGARAHRPFSSHCRYGSGAAFAIAAFRTAINFCSSPSQSLNVNR